MAYCGLQDARQQATVEPGRQQDDDLLMELIFEATQIVSDYCGQSFEEQIATYGFNGEIGSANATLELQERPLISIVTLTNGDGTNVAASAYDLLPIGIVYPKKRIRMKVGNRWTSPIQSPPCGWGALPDQAYAEDAIQVNGIWAFNRRGTLAWSDTGLTLNGNISASAAQLTLSGAPNFKFDVGAMLRIDSEYFQVTGPIASSSEANGFTATTLDIQSAYNGSTAAAHTTGTKVYVYQVEPTIRRATAIAAAWLYDGRLNSSGPDMSAPGLGQMNISMRLSPRAAQLLGFPFYNKWYGQG